MVVAEAVDEHVFIHPGPDVRRISDGFDYRASSPDRALP